jgi:hypothetical protein
VLNTANEISQQLLQWADAKRQHRPLQLEASDTFEFSRAAQTRKLENFLLQICETWRTH